MPILRRKRRERAFRSGREDLKEITKRWTRKPTLDEVFTALSLTFFESLGRSLVKTFELDKAILKAGLSVHPTIYAAKTLMLTFLTAVTSLLSVTMFLILVPAGLIVKVIAVVFAAVVPISVLALRLSYPALVASDRKMRVESELPVFMAYASTMVKAGVSLDKIIERIAELKVFKALREEARRVLTRVRMFGDDPISALEYVALNHPSVKFRDVMLGYTTTLRSGGDVVHYMEVRTRELFEARSVEIKLITERLASFLELYIVLGVIMSVTVFVFFAVSGTLTAVSAGRTAGIAKVDITMPSLYNFVVLPILGLAVLLMIHYSQPKTPVKVVEPYYTLLPLIPVSVIAFYATLSVTGGLDIFNGVLGIAEVKSLIISSTVATLIVSIPPWLTYRKVMKGHKGLVSSVADFLRDLSEVRKTGLSPEKCLISLSTRDYKNLTPLVSRAGAALSIGLSLEESLRRVVKGVKEWFVIAIFRFLTDSIIVGGGSPEVLDVLARFTQSLSELEVEMRRRLKAYVFLPYFGVVMLASAPTIIINLLATAGGVGPEALAPLIAVLGVGGMVNAYIMGLIAGKSTEMSVASGFKHSILMVVLTTATILTTMAYLHMI